MAGAVTETMTVKEAAKRSGWSTESVYLAIRSGILPAQRFARAYRVAASDVDRWANREIDGRSGASGPRRKYDACINVNLPLDMFRIVSDMAESAGVPKAEMARILIRKGLEL